MTISKFSIQIHDQKQRKNQSHWDLRIINPDNKNKTLSFAFPKSRFPEPKEKLLIIQTKDHPKSYMYYQGTLENGDHVSLYDRGVCNIITNREKFKIIQFIGKKIKGIYNFIYLNDKNEKTWLIIKSNKPSKV